MQLSTVQQNIEENPYIFIFFFIVFCVNIGFIIFMAVFLGDETFSESDYSKADQLKLGITITAIILLFIITLIMLILIIKTYCLT